MRWQRSSRFDPRAVRIADRHYSRQKVGTPQFVAPGRCIVLLAPELPALWVSRWTVFPHHGYGSCWECALFRNEGAQGAGVRSSLLIREAVAVTRQEWGVPPAGGFITFVDPGQVEEKEYPGWCFRRAGWRRVGVTPKGLLVFRLSASRFPVAERPASLQLTLF